MSLKISKSDITSWKNKAQRLQTKLRSTTSTADKTIGTLVHTAEVSSAAFVAGVVQGKFGGIGIFGVPMDLGLASALHVMAFAGVGGNMASHLHGFGDGFLAAFLTTTGQGVGRVWAAKELTEEKPAEPSGQLPGTNRNALPSGDFLTEEDRRMAALAAAI